MKIIPICDLHEQLNTAPTAIALGNFDGVHLGHQALIARTLCQGERSAVFTFEDRLAGIITPLCEKARLFEALGVEYLFVAPFSLFKGESPESFVRYLVKKLGASRLVCGYNFRFGKGAVGTPALLQALAEENGVTAEIEAEVTERGENVSSTHIRTLLDQGELAHAEALLGHPYTLVGKVVRGYGIGKTLSFATLNLDLYADALVPHGVYISEATIDGARYPAITNIGSNPTFNRDKISCETHLLDTAGEFYEKRVSLRLLSYMRGERTFASPEELKKQVLADVETARAFHQKGGKSV